MKTEDLDLCNHIVHAEQLLSLVYHIILFLLQEAVGTKCSMQAPMPHRDHMEDILFSFSGSRVEICRPLNLARILSEGGRVNRILILNEFHTGKLADHYSQLPESYYYAFKYGIGDV
ncbi:hypothetical protein Ancab_010418 [Ancistrocladus abbreviatus]